MDFAWYRKAMEKPPRQNIIEWQLLFEFLGAFFRNRGIENPIVVEIGVRTNNQKIFWEKLLDAKHIGIDIADGYGVPDILGDSKDLKTFEALKKALGGKRINVLFIDGDHSYDGVKNDYEIYSPLTEDIVIFHDIHSPKYEVWKFWEEMAEKHKRPSMTIGSQTGLIILKEGKT